MPLVTCGADGSTKAEIVEQINTNTTKSIFPADTMTDLLAVDESIYKSVNVKGYHAVNDGGGGLFNYDSTIDKSTANAGTIIDPSVSLANQGTGIGNGCWMRQYDDEIKLKWFGGDLLLAINTGEDVDVNMDYSGENITLHEKQKIFSSVNSILTINSITLNNYSSVSGIYFNCLSSLGIDGNFTGSTLIKTFVNIDNINDAVFEKNKIYNLDSTITNISMYSGDKCESNKNTLLSGKYGIIVSSSSVECAINENRIDGGGDTGIMLHTGTGELSHSHIVQRNIITNGVNHGVMLWSMDSAELNHSLDMYDCIIVKNIIENMTGAGIWTAVCSRINVYGNTIKNVTKEGIDFEGSADCKASGNILHNAGVGFGSLAAFFGSKRCTYLNNTITFDGNFPLLGGGNNPLASSLWGYFRDSNEDIFVSGNTVSAINSNGKMTDLTVYKGDTTNYSSIGTNRLVVENNTINNGCIYMNALTPNASISRNRFNLLDFFAKYIIYSINSEGLTIESNKISLLDGTVKGKIGNDDSVIFIKCDTDPQTVKGLVVRGNIVKNINDGVSIINWYSGVTDYGSMRISENTLKEIYYSTTIVDKVIENNYKDDTFAASTITTI